MYAFSDLCFKGMIKMTNKEYVLQTLRRQGREAALAVQAGAAGMTGTELNAERDYVPDFEAAKAALNMLKRQKGFVCRSTAGRLVRLSLPYDSDIYPQEPEELDAQWGFVWSTDPAHALPFVAIATSPYNTGELCSAGGKIWRSLTDNNVHSPENYPQGWEEVTH